jgi:type I restriction enzyme, S subunit
MSCDWPLVKLDELANEITVGFVGSMTHEYVDKGVPFFRSKNISEYEIEWYDIRYISPAFHRRLKKSVLRPGDVAIVRTGKPGTACVIPDSVDEANCSDIVIVRVNNDKLSAHYLCYFMNSIASHQVSSHLVGAVQQHFNVASAKTIKIPLPKRDEQEEIVKILKALDDKRKINHQINQTLEAMAQAIFKSWFVDFEPVKAKIAAIEAGEDTEGVTRAAMSAISGKTDEELDQMQAEQPECYMQLKTTAELFPSSMQDSELGKIPGGWEVKRLEDIAAINENSIKKDYPHNEIIYVDISSVDNGKLVETIKYETKKAPSRAKRIVKNGDIIWSMVRPNRRSYLLILDPQENLVVSTGFAVISPKVVSYPYLYFLLTTDAFVNYLSLSADGSAYPAVTAERFKETKVLVPEQAALNEFEKITSSLLIEINCNSTESLELSKIRDSLLPKLLSGEISVGTSELVEE